MSTSANNPTDERIDQLTREMASTRRWTRGMSNLVLALGLLVFALLCGYFGYFYYVMDDLTKPDRAVRAIGSVVNERSPEMFRMAATEIRNNAPTVAKQLSEEFLRQLPEARKRLEASVERVVDEQIKAAHDHTATEFERIAREHREEFRDAIEAMIDKEDSQAFVDKTMPIFESEYIPGLRYDAIQILGVLDDLNQKFDRLASNKNLNPVEQQMRHILGLTRYLREKEVPGTVDGGE